MMETEFRDVLRFHKTLRILLMLIILLKSVYGLEKHENILKVASGSFTTRGKWDLIENRCTYGPVQWNTKRPPQFLTNQDKGFLMEFNFVLLSAGVKSSSLRFNRDWILKLCPANPDNKVFHLDGECIIINVNILAGLLEDRRVFVGIFRRALPRYSDR